MRSVEVDAPLTGTSSRMKSLPLADISSHHSHVRSSPEPMLSQAVVAALSTTGESESVVTNRKCVYTYEDKYTFARILVSDSLVFDSHFESGNLHSAFRITPPDGSANHVQMYDLYIHNDVHTTGHTQWFYFSVSNTRMGQGVTFSLRNFSKSDSLFNDGMRPLMFSVKEENWRRVGTNISYDETAYASRNSINIELGRKKKKFIAPLYTMTFTHTFEHTNDLCYFAYCHPYTYSDLRKYLNELELATKHMGILRRNILCKTLAGNSCDVLTITESSATPEEIKERIVVLITARVHPGETNASWMMQGVLEYLTADNEIAHSLRKHYIFKIIPMMNPDGVINGNYRTSLSGCDLNRRWHKPDKVLHPTIYHTKNLIRRLKRTNIVAYAIDLHGHSKKEGIFIYGCVPDRKIARLPSPRRPINTDCDTVESQIENSQSHVSKTTRPLDMVECKTSSTSTLETGVLYHPTLTECLTWKIRLFPRLLSVLSPMFSMESCNYRLHKSKASTMRVVSFLELGIDCVYTVEASLAGKMPNHFDVFDLMEFGSCICECLVEMYPLAQSRTASLNPFSELIKNVDGDRRDLREEIHKWTSIVEFSQLEKGCTILSQTGLKELQSAANDEEGKDDDDSDIPEEKEKEKDTKQESTKSSKKSVMKKHKPKKYGTKFDTEVKCRNSKTADTSLKNVNKSRHSKASKILLTDKDESIINRLIEHVKIRSSQASDTRMNVIPQLQLSYVNGNSMVDDRSGCDSRGAHNGNSSRREGAENSTVAKKEFWASTARSKDHRKSTHSRPQKKRFSIEDEANESRSARSASCGGKGEFYQHMKNRIQRRKSMGETYVRTNQVSKTSRNVVEMVFNDQFGLVSDGVNNSVLELQKQEEDTMNAYLRSKDVLTDLDQYLQTQPSFSDHKRVEVDSTNVHIDLSLLGRSGSQSVSLPKLSDADFSAIGRMNLVEVMQPVKKSTFHVHKKN